MSHYQLETASATKHSLATALNGAIRVGASDVAKQLLAAPKNRPYYHQFAKAKFLRKSS